MYKVIILINYLYIYIYRKKAWLFLYLKIYCSKCYYYILLMTCFFLLTLSFLLYILIKYSQILRFSKFCIIWKEIQIKSSAATGYVYCYKPVAKKFSSTAQYFNKITPKINPKILCERYIFIYITREWVVLVGESKTEIKDGCF